MSKLLPTKRNQPIHINHHCPNCSTCLIPFDQKWHDEWICPQCQDGIHMDWTAEDFKQVENLLE